jgi:hypothetical protein
MQSVNVGHQGHFTGLPIETTASELRPGRYSKDRDTTLSRGKTHAI